MPSNNDYCFCKDKNKSWNWSSTEKWLSDGEWPIFSTITRPVLYSISAVSVLQASEPSPLQTNYSTTWQDKWVLKETSETQSVLLDYRGDLNCFTTDWFLMVNRSSLGRKIDVKVCHQMVVGNLSRYSWWTRRNVSKCCVLDSNTEFRLKTGKVLILL